MVEIGNIVVDGKIVDYCIYCYDEDCEHSQELLSQAQAMFRGLA